MTYDVFSGTLNLTQQQYVWKCLKTYHLSFSICHTVLLSQMDTGAMTVFNSVESFKTLQLEFDIVAVFDIMLEMSLAFVDVFRCFCRVILLQ